MVFIFITLAVGLALVAIRCQRSTRWFLLACCALNLAGAAKAIHQNDPYAFRLKPSSVYSEPPLRR